MNCNNCGSSNFDGARFCVSCGSEIIINTPNINPAQNQQQNWQNNNNEQNSSQTDTWGFPPQAHPNPAEQNNQWGQGQQPNDPWGNNQWGQHPNGQQNQGFNNQPRRTTPAMVLAIISYVLIVISWWVPLVIDLFFSVPAIGISAIAFIIAIIEYRKDKKVKRANESLVLSGLALAASIVSTIIFIALIAIS
ncbi:MAG: zinc ribbon domain-containing protein [Firmicutes bacterium]|nr:zinc ribbon domain-containing protein [Bacillota bacterium]